MTVAAVIPARWASSRFPGKPLAPIHGRPMLAHVIERVREARRIDRIVVATDDDRIAAAAADAGAEAVITGPAATGSDRIAAVVREDPGLQVIVNVQGDEPMLTGAVIDAVAAPLAAEPAVQVATAARPFEPGEDPSDPNRVKVVWDGGGNALYFSRSVIPYCREGSKGDDLPAPHLHLGIYAYRREPLLAFAAATPTPLERAEALEQLRFLERGVAIRVVPVAWRGYAVDVPADVAVVEAAMPAPGGG